MEETTEAIAVTIAEVEEDPEKVIRALTSRLESHNKNREEIQDKLHSLCEQYRSQVDESEKEANESLEKRFSSEVDSLQSALSGCSASEDNDKLVKKLEECEERRRTEQEKIEEAYEAQRREIDNVEEKVNSELEGLFTREDGRLQAALAGLQSALTAASDNKKKKTRPLRSFRKQGQCCS